MVLGREGEGHLYEILRPEKEGGVGEWDEVGKQPHKWK